MSRFLFCIFLLFLNQVLRCCVHSEEVELQVCSKGEPGATGHPGKQGERGDKGAKGAKGIPGQNGDKGEQGEPGHIGPPGRMGHPGEIGPRGLPGKPGLHGEKGEKGPPGPPGVIGLKGSYGIIGLPGPRGASGIDGRDGSPGPPGPPGIAGEQGPTGPEGKRGIQGQKGQKGERGFSGPPGAEGADGIPGSPGHQGHQGPKGNKGERGVPGYKGEQGSQGPKGPELSEENVRRYFAPLKGLQNKVDFIQGNLTESLMSKLRELQAEVLNITAELNWQQAILDKEPTDRPVAHLYTPGYGTQFLYGGTRVRYWSTNHTGYLLQGGMNYSDGYITVPVSGLYYIYFQLTPKPLSSSYPYYDVSIVVDGSHVARGYHYFVTYNGNSDRSQFLSVVQNVDKGSQLSVVLNQYNYYYFNYPSSFFGAFKLSPSF